MKIFIKSGLCILVTLMMCGATGMYDKTQSISTKNDDTAISNSEENISNSMLTMLPMYIDDKNIYYAENAKNLKDMNTGQLLDSCNNQELIWNIYSDDKYIYYAKSDSYNTHLIAVTKENNDKKELFTISNSRGCELSRSFIYAYQDTIYYFDDIMKVLYSYKDNTLRKPLENITSVTFNGGNIYYADTDRVIYKCNIDFSEKEELWDANVIKECHDEAVIDWCHSSFNEYSSVHNLSVWNDGILFSLDSGSGNYIGILIYIKDGIAEYSALDRAITYQQMNGKIVVYGSSYCNESRRCIYLTDLKNSEKIDVNSSMYFFVSDNTIHFYPLTKRGIGYGRLAKFDIIDSV